MAKKKPESPLKKITNTAQMMRKKIDKGLGFSRIDSVDKDIWIDP